MKLRIRDTRGSAMVEMAMTMPLFLLLIMGSFELGRLAYFAIEVQTASRAGASYGSVNLGNDSASSTNVQQAAKNDVPDLTNMTSLTVSTPVTECVCETITTSSGTASFSGFLSCTDATINACTGGNSSTQYYNIRYIKVDTQATVDPMVHLPGLPKTYTLFGTTRMRVLEN